jgi:hypothetical protein
MTIHDNILFLRNAFILLLSAVTTLKNRLTAGNNLPPINRKCPAGYILSSAVSILNNTLTAINTVILRRNLFILPTFGR